MYKTKYFYYSVRYPTPLMVILPPLGPATWGIANIYFEPRQRYTTGTMCSITLILHILFLL